MIYKIYSEEVTINTGCLLNSAIPRIAHVWLLDECSMPPDGVSESLRGGGDQKKTTIASTEATAMPAS